MAKADAVFTIGADASAFSREAKKVEGQTHDFLTRLGGKFFGLQAIAVGVQKAFAGLSAPIRAFGGMENTQAQLAVMMDSKSAAESHLLPPKARHQRRGEHAGPAGSLEPPHARHGGRGYLRGAVQRRGRGLLLHP